MTNLVYLAGPIAAVSYEQARFWRGILGGLLAERGLAAFDPAGAFHVDPQDAPLIAESVQPVNDYAIRRAAVVLVGYQDAPSAGTDAEIAFAQRLGKTILVLALTSKNLPLWYMDRFGSTFSKPPRTEEERAAALNLAWRERVLFFGYSRDDYTTVADGIAERVRLLTERSATEAVEQAKRAALASIPHKGDMG